MISGDNMDLINFKQLNDTEEQYRMIYDWCSNEFVYKYFEQRKLSYDEILKKYKKRLRKNAHTKTLIINYNDTDIGIIQYGRVGMEDIRRFNLFSYPDCYQLDIFIGNQDYLHKGIGKLSLKKLMDYLSDKYNINNFVAFIEEENANSLNCFNKLGFDIYKRFKQFNGLKEKTNYVLCLRTKDN